jgi:hypothetical protein
MGWGVTFAPPPPLRANALSSSPHICGRCPGSSLGTPLNGHMQQICLYGPAPHMERSCIRVAPPYYTFALTSCKRVNPEVLRLERQDL